MKQVYSQAYDWLIELVEQSREKILNIQKQFENSIGALFFLGDKQHGAYKTIVDTNEYRAAKAIETIATALFSEYDIAGFSLYPIASEYKSLPEPEQAKSRPFQIILSENGRNTGIVFSPDFSYASECSEKFENGKYEKVDALKIVINAVPDASTRKLLFSDVNAMNKGAGILVERLPILDFWEQCFGKAECDELKCFCNEFNEKAKELIGFNTVVTPTEKALKQFRKRCGEEIQSPSHNYINSIPETVYSNQVETMRRNYLDRGLWKAMIGKSNYADSFITSEWFFTMYQLTENLDLTNVVAGYLKSVEQLLATLIQLSGSQVTAKVNGEIKLLNAENIEDSIDTTLGALENIIKHNGDMLEVNKYAKNYLVDSLDDWREKQRNGYFHKDNLHDTKKVGEIREKALQLYFVILGSWAIRDDQLSQLGIDA